MNVLDLFLVAVILIVFAYISYRKKSLDKEGIIAGMVIGIVSYLLGEQLGIGGLVTLLVMVAFFIIAELSTRLARIRIGESHERRTTGNILGNSGSAILALLIGGAMAPIAFYGAMSSALADTISSEIGMLSKKKPRLITNLRKEVEPGVDGGVTFLGLVAGFLGALTISFIYFLISVYYFNRFEVLIIPIITVAGFCGTLVDSLLGAVFERRKMLGNTSVNFLASASGAIIAVLLFGLV